MNILIAYYSRKGYSQRLAAIIRDGLEARGHRVELEVIRPVGMSDNSWALLARCMPSVPYILCSCFVKRLKRYRQPEVEIAPLEHPDVSPFDLVIIGGPKWVHLSFPIARYLKQVSGLAGKKVGGYTCFCGSPLLENFEIYAYFFPFNDLIRRAGGEVIAQLALSSGYTDIRLLPTPWFRMICRLRFRRPLSYFVIDSEWGKGQIQRFCEAIDSDEVRQDALLLA